jgi:hypothetical protein
VLSARLAPASVVIAAGVWTRLRPIALSAGIVLALAYWVLGQSMGAPGPSRTAEVVRTS